VEAVGDGADVQPGDRVYTNLGVAGGGFAEYALADADRLARMPERVSFEEAGGLVVGGGTAWDGLVDRGRPGDLPGRCSRPAGAGRRGR
jgi:NADPH2:quinone reductase